MLKEGIVVQLRNFSRQRKSIEYYFRDLGYLLNFAVIIITIIST